MRSYILCPGCAAVSCNPNYEVIYCVRVVLPFAATHIAKLSVVSRWQCQWVSAQKNICHIRLPVGGFDQPISPTQPYVTYDYNAPSVVGVTECRATVIGARYARYQTITHTTLAHAQLIAHTTLAHTVWAKTSPAHVKGYPMLQPSHYSPSSILWHSGGEVGP